MKIKIDQQLSPHFNLKEFVNSDTARKLGIDNTPTLRDIANLRELCVRILEPLRDFIGEPIKITSGYRCPRLNKAVGGVATSAHIVGFAADIKPTKSTMKDFKEKVLDFFTKTGIPFDQVIDEKAGRSVWVHIGLKNLAGKQRKEIFKITK